jgi:hypothetical protein
MLITSMASLIVKKAVFLVNPTNCVRKVPSSMEGLREKTVSKKA